MRNYAIGSLTTALFAAAAVTLGTTNAAADTVPSSQGQTTQVSATHVSGFMSPRFIESGEASWYGPRHEGRRTTSGEVFNSNKLTAAHPSLPLGSYVRVTVQETGRTIVVKVNDREPPHGVRCIDLSHAAAAKLGIVSRGVADVTLETASRDEAEEVAEAPDDITANSAARPVSSRHGRRHRRHAHQ